MLSVLNYEKSCYGVSIWLCCVLIESVCKLIYIMVKPVWTTRALERDNSKCIECGSENSLVVHIIDGDEKNHHLNNLMTLCRHCHAEVHGQILRFSNPTISLIHEMRMQGKTYSFISKHLGISRQRVHQIKKRYEELLDI